MRKRRRPNGVVRAPRRREVLATAPRSSGDAARDLREVRRAEVGRWWLRVQPHADGSWRAEAHTVSGSPGVWAGDMRPTLAEATADALAIVDELRAT
ncbi:MAG: hypothetical protein Q7V88_05345 [Actinomycetota bacterium]|nr:hypothetical protein [Actinomycetota bacterium]